MIQQYIAHAMHVILLYSVHTYDIFLHHYFKTHTLT